jgi:hypothetical protein
MRWRREKTRRRALTPDVARLVKVTRITDTLCRLELRVPSIAAQSYRTGTTHRLKSPLVGLPIGIDAALEVGGPVPILRDPRAPSHVCLDYAALGVSPDMEETLFIHHGTPKWMASVDE